MRAFDFSGRSRRREYFVFYAELVVVVCSITNACDVPSDPGKPFDASATFNHLPVFVQIVLGIFILVSLIPGLSVQVRRLHDSNRTGWWLLLNAIPFLGHFFTFLLMLAGGTADDNRFGKNPRHLVTPSKG